MSRKKGRVTVVFQRRFFILGIASSEEIVLYKLTFDNEMYRGMNISHPQAFDLSIY